MEVFSVDDLKKLYKPPKNSSGEDNGQVTIIGGSSLFHGAPLLSLKVASKVVDMVFFASPEPSVGRVTEQIKSKLFSFIWVPWEEVGEYIEKSDAVLIGPGFLRYRSEKQPLFAKAMEGKESLYDTAGRFTRSITERLLKKFPQKRWVIDAGSLQTMEAGWIPKGAILTPNKKEFKILFGDLTLHEAAKKYDCIIVLKGPATLVVSPDKAVEVTNGNAGLTKGGTGDVQAGLAVALLAKNDPFLAACASSYLVKKTADNLYQKVGVNFSADDLTDFLPQTFHNLRK